MLVIVLACSLIIYLIVTLKQNKIALRQLRHELEAAKSSLKKSSVQIQNARAQYGQIIKSQFDEWKLSPSEQQIAMLLLKGLSFNEIAALRETKEKTVRQQASEIYKKIRRFWPACIFCLVF